MNRDILWAPWRVGYVRQEIEQEPCFLCRIIGENRDSDNFVLYRCREALALLNRFPYNNGHLLVAPRRHIGELESLDGNETAELMHTVNLMLKTLKKVLNPDGFNIGFNLGKFSGAGLEEHLHCHVVPRWGGDTNFMPIITGTKVISQSMQELYDAMLCELR